MINLFFLAAAKIPSIAPVSCSFSGGHELLMGLAGIVCGALLIYAILSQL